MDFSRGIPPECRTLIAIPTMLLHERNVNKLIESIEVHFLANRNENLRFALLTDFRDAETEKFGSGDGASDCTQKKSV